MLAERRQRLLLVLERQNRISLAELARLMAVSPRTLRDDIEALETDGHPVGIQGKDVFCGSRAALAEANPLAAERPEVDAGHETTIARWAAGLVTDGDIIFLDASTAVYSMAPFLSGRRALVVFTNGIEIARLLAQNPANQVFLVAGIVRPAGASVVGPLYEPVLRSRQIKTAFVSCQGFSLAAGLTETDPDEAAVKSQLINLAGSTVALIGSGKFGRVYRSPFARAAQIAHIFSDNGLDPKWAEQLQRSSIVLTNCV